MKNFTHHSIIKYIALIVMLMSLTTYSQDIHFTFANAQNTNDGSNDFYEVDVMIQTINSTGSFKLGSGQLYFNYNTLAFGSNIKAGGSFTVTHTNPDYICGQFVDAAAAAIYGPFTTNDNTTSRVSWAFSQAFSSSTFAADNVTPTAKKLCHIKIKYAGTIQDPMFLFEDGTIYDDQFYTACGPAGGPFTTADCGASPGTQLLNDTFDSGGATLSNKSIENPVAFGIYPNPASEVINVSTNLQLTHIELYNMLGKRVLNTTNTKQLRVNHLNTGMYFLKAHSATGTLTKKIMLE